MQNGDLYIKHYNKKLNNPYNNKPEIKIVNVLAKINVALPEANLIFFKNNEIFEKTNTTKHCFKIIHYELAISCRFQALRNTFATKCIKNECNPKL